jgi:hypothetical protein
MMNKRVVLRAASAASLIVVASFITRDAEAQSIASRVAAVRNGKVRMTFASRPDVCGFGNSISRGRNSGMSGTSDPSSDVVYDDECSHSPVRLVFTVDGGRVTKLRTYVGGRWRPATSETTDLGAVSTKAATDYLVFLAATDQGKVGREAILPATLADSVNVWPQLFRVARNNDVPRETRNQAVFWLGQAAADRVSPEHYSVRESDDSEVRKQAVFALSQRRSEASVSALIEVARKNRDPEVRRSALFWLGQSGDPRAISLFEEILSR